MPYCHIHGPFDEYEDGCPKCRDVEEKEASDRDTIISELARLGEEAIETAASAAYVKNNPGDYECPSCGYITLKYCRNRCPICKADVPSGYWTPIIERERLEAERARKAKEEWERGAPVRAAKTRENEARKKRIERWEFFSIIYYAYLIPVSFAFIIPNLYANEMPPNGDVGALYIPVINWIGLILVSFHKGFLFVIILCEIILWFGLHRVVTAERAVSYEELERKASEWQEVGEKKQKRYESIIGYARSVINHAFGFGVVSAGLGVVLGYGKGCSRFADSFERGQPDLLEPFRYIPETVLYAFIVGAVIGIIVGVFRLDKQALKK